MELELQRFADGENSMAPSAGDVTGQKGQAAAPEQAGGQASPFQELIQGQYKQEYEQAVGQRINAAMQRRFKNQDDLQKRLDEQSPIMEQLAAKYQLDAGDIDGIYKHMTDDLSLYQEEADKRGVSPEVVRDMHRLEANNKRLQAENERFTEQGRLEEHFRQMSQQAEELKKQFPNFDLMAELQNPAFARMTRPGSGMSVENAFWAIHGAQIQAESMQHAAQQAGQRIAASVQAGASRPIENGMQRAGAVDMGVDIAHMDKKTRDMYRQRIKNGELIDFKSRI